MDVVSILKQKYGNRLINVVPTHASAFNLYDDHLCALEIVKDARAGIRIH